MVMRPPALIAGVVTVALVVVLGMAGAYFLALHAIGQSQQAWCPALRQLTASPPAATAPPAVHTFYRELGGVKQRFGCPP